MSGNDWNRSELYITKTLERVESKLDKQADEIVNIKIKCAIYGFIGACIPVLIAVVGLWQHQK